MRSGGQGWHLGDFAMTVHPPLLRSIQSNKKKQKKSKSKDKEQDGSETRQGSRCKETIYYSQTGIDETGELEIQEELVYIQDTVANMVANMVANKVTNTVANTIANKVTNLVVNRVMN